MEAQENPSLLIKLGAPIFFVALTLTMLYVFASNVYLTLSGVLSHSNTISFYKGALYLLGSGLGVAIFAYFSIVELWLGKKLAPKTSKFLMKMAIGSAVLMLILPHVAHYSLDGYLASNGYEQCNAASRQWLHSKTIVYVNHEKVCEELVRQEK